MSSWSTGTNCAGEETSFGNAGMIECASVFPYMFPRDFGQILRYALNRAPQVRYSLADLPGFLPWLLRYYLASSPDRALRGALAEMPLIRRSLIEHEALIAEAGVLELLRRSGWIKMYRYGCNARQCACGISSERSNTAFRAKSSTARRSSQREPHLSGEFAGAVHFTEPGFVLDPGGLAKAYAALFHRKGGRFVVGDAQTLEQEPGGRWQVATPDGKVSRTRSRGGTRTVVRSGVRPPRLFDPAQRQARLPSASGAARQCRAASSRARCR